jgi:hypothetical protein
VATNLENSPEPPNRVVARGHAVEIAHLLDSKSISYRRRTSGEPVCLYRIPFHTEDFWFKVLVSDTDYIFTGEHRRQNSFSVPFCAAIKNGWKNLRATEHLAALSSKLGFPIYTIERSSEIVVSKKLLEPKTLKLLSQIDLVPVRLFFINSVQIHFVSELISPERCAHQVQLLRELLLTIYKASHDDTA